MLSQELRQFTLDEMSVQEENKKIRKAIIKNPEQAPKCLIFAGKFGCGKTTLSRILARELNGIKDRDFDLLTSRFYYEYDSTVIGNVETIRNLRDQFLVSYGDYYRVIVFDECHMVSGAAQNALLKVLEEAQGRVFFILCTTEPNKLLPTIRSRSLELEFTTVPKEEIVKNLTTVSEQRDITLPDDIKLIIADRSAGHMRNAHMLLDKYILLGEEDFKDSVRSSITMYCKYLVACYMNDKDNVLKYINELMNIPKDDLQSDWNTVITESMRGYTGFEVRHPDVKTLINVYKSDFNIVVNCFFSAWIKNAFVDMCYFQATFLNMYLLISQTIQGKKSTESAKTAQQTTNTTSQVSRNVLLR